MTWKMKVLVGVSVLLNLGVFGIGAVAWMNTYNDSQAMLIGFMVFSGALNLYLIGYEFRSTERRLEKRVRIARMEKELADLGR
jgi:multisubunit Na+/H+ antiporter MnhC subunit